MKHTAVFFLAFLSLIVLVSARELSVAGMAGCTQGSNLELRIKECTQLLNRPNLAKPSLAELYHRRGVAQTLRGAWDSAIDDFTKALQHKPNFAEALEGRGQAYNNKGEFDIAIRDVDKAISLKPKYWYAHNQRGWAYVGKREYRTAIPSFEEALRLKPDFSPARFGRATAYREVGEFDRAAADITELITGDPKNARNYYERAGIYMAANDLSRAIADLRIALPLSTDDAERATFENTLHGLEQKLAATTPLAQPERRKSAAPVSLGSRIALVIGNANYESVKPLENPIRDAESVGAALRGAGFQDVAVVKDVDLAKLKDALKGFADRALGADWAVVYYAGHGIEIDGINFIIPTDAKLRRDQHVKFETVPLEMILDSLAGAKQFKLVILDACRENPFLQQMARTFAMRSVGRGFAPIEPRGGVLVAYAARHGEVAADGKPGTNSPFTTALLRYIEEPGLEIGLFFRKVRDAVMSATGNVQEPYTYGSLSGEPLYFQPTK